jgi:hypothetical protein
MMTFSRAASSSFKTSMAGLVAARLNKSKQSLKVGPLRLGISGPMGLPVPAGAGTATALILLPVSSEIWIVTESKPSITQPDRERIKALELRLDAAVAEHRRMRRELDALEARDRLVDARLRRKWHAKRGAPTCDVARLSPDAADPDGTIN